MPEEIPINYLAWSFTGPTPDLLRARFDLLWALADAGAVSLGEQSTQLVLGRSHAQAAGQFPGRLPMLTLTAEPQFAGGVARHVLERVQPTVALAFRTSPEHS